MYVEGGGGKTWVVGSLCNAPYKIFYTNLKQAFEGGVCVNVSIADLGRTFAMKINL